MSTELIARYRAEGSHEACLAERLAVAVVTGEVSDPDARRDVLEDLRDANARKERYRQQADYLEADPNAWVRTGPAWLD